MAKKTIINVTLIGDEDIRKLNKEYLQRDSTTDVLSFHIEEKTEEGNFYLGDVLVNQDQAKRQASTYGNTYEEEIAALVEHGVLHLLGVHHPHDDEEEVHGILTKS